MNAKPFFERLEAHAAQNPERLAGLEHSYLFVVDGEGRWLVDVRDGKLTVTEDGDGADVTIKTSAETFEKIAAGKQNPATAYMTGKLKVTGDLSAALKLQKLF